VKRIPLGELARLLDGQLEGDPAQVIEGIRPLSEAGPRDVSFLANPRYGQPWTRAARGGDRRKGRVSPGPGTAEGPRPVPRVRRAVEIFHKEPYEAGGVSAQAHVSPGATSAPNPPSSRSRSCARARTSVTA